MKKRHEQKLIIITLGLLLAFNIPIILVFNIDGAIYGIPYFYFYVFGVWLISVIISYIILNRYYE
ncbi:hypothetical protein [Maribacter polysaccharolyticus]|uniref:hypothetical protein n=1 Tax=Maribacter polysaccharolyticus TaxID=3020831 RepID=UPI00237FA4B2|nr:hypothetical protein [Maribacter polysaccharolyticus]MDE3743570.1 hypothetical protein [Maribacter polysaccharolyticus]